MSADFDPDPFTDALREDLPSAQDEARVRARLATAGVLAGVGAVAPGATAAATSGTAAGTATAGVVTKVLALPLAAKLGGAALLACAVAVPVVRAHARGVVPAAVMGGAAPARANASPLAGSRQPAANVVATPVAPAEPGTAAPLVAAPLVTTPLAATPVAASRAERAKSRDAGSVTVAATNGASASLPAVGAFPVAEAPVDEGTLRAETTLMEQALGALKRGDLATAKQKLAEHAQSFPDGHLAPERERALARIREKETSR